MPTKIYKLNKMLEGEINMVKEDPVRIMGWYRTNLRENDI